MNKATMRVSRFFCALWCAALFLCPVAAWSEGTPLRIVVEANRAPFSFRTPSGVLAGFDVAIAKALGHEMQRPSLITTQTRNNALEALEKGDVDLVLAGLVPTPELKNRFQLSERYYRTMSVFVTATGETTLLKKRIGVIENTPQHDALLEKNYDSHFFLVSSSLQTLWRLLLTNAVHAVFVDNLTAHAFLLSPDGKNYDTTGLPVSDNNRPSTHHIAIGKSQKNLCTEVNRALQALRRNGTFLKISHRYFTIDVD